MLSETCKHAPSAQWECGGCCGLDSSAALLLPLLVQVESLLEGPRLQNKLDNERAIIQSLNML